jgi:hypothetical protein
LKQAKIVQKVCQRVSLLSHCLRIDKLRVSQILQSASPNSLRKICFVVVLYAILANLSNVLVARNVYCNNFVTLRNIQPLQVLKQILLCVTHAHVYIFASVSFRILALDSWQQGI